ncbi:Ribosome-binding factor A [Aquisphaera giovannonii]|uniref:Ribosome-binding factor A n=1 Tax=Aquisphaera giovannonii TaxID=406548 RepID=A0A5B9VXC6_9BACT|nr:30S ribosome-binding factor RbfA [Aquisphaera giovannonii]QEH33036.1 Ribosome-binding factor A [Aquisphaera giovannonii]
MPSHRSLRVAEAIREVVASAVLFEASDPRIRGVTVLRSEVSGDLRNATVYVSVMGTPGEQKLALAGLKHAAGFLQAKVAARLQTKVTPVLSFKIDDSVKKSVEMARLIAEAVASDRKPGEGDAPAPGPEGADDEDEGGREDEGDVLPRPGPASEPRDP